MGGFKRPGAALEEEYEVLRVRRDELRRESLREVLIAETINGVESSIPVSSYC